MGRLRKRADFLRVAASGRKWAAPGVIIQADQMPAEETPEADVRVGFTVTRKVGGSVIRNRARRRLRAAAAAVIPGQSRAGFDFVLIGRQGTLTRPFPALVDDVAAALARLGATAPAPQKQEP